MATLLVATIGGHLTQLVDIVGRLPLVDGRDIRVWVTHDHAQSRSLLHGEKTVFVPYVGAKDVPGVLRNAPVAHRLQREWRFTRVVSTGSGVALGYLPYLAARGVQAHYIESATRVGGPSVTGRLLGRVPGVRVYTQYRHLADSRWRYAGSVFDGFTAVVRTERAVIRRAVVAVGTMNEFPFRRMLDAVVPLLRAGGVVERAQGSPIETLWQTGGTSVEGLGIEAREWLPAAEMEAQLAAADVVVTHAGTGSALSALRAGRWPVLLPRREAFAEIGDDHQDRFARDLAQRGLALHRAVDELTADDIFLAATRRVDRATAPPPFELVP
jgi:UDP-N-acetylglucosamine--N-acetylmuramyl-(pentapeptide) pyrophosphoryl-undecaprenol N-acetylglucosamine transferase